MIQENVNLAANYIAGDWLRGRSANTVEVTNPERVAMLSQVKIGDTITAVVSEALAVSIEPAR